MKTTDKWDGCFNGACLCCGDDVWFPISKDGLCQEDEEGVCGGCGRVYLFGVEEGDDGGPSVGYLRESEDGDERPKCSCPDEEFEP